MTYAGVKLARPYVIVGGFIWKWIFEGFGAGKYKETVDIRLESASKITEIFMYVCIYTVYGMNIFMILHKPTVM